MTIYTKLDTDPNLEDDKVNYQVDETMPITKTFNIEVIDNRLSAINQKITVLEAEKTILEAHKSYIQTDLNII